MRRAAALVELENVVRRQLLDLRYDVIKVQRHAAGRELEIGMTYVLINLASTWANFLRAYYLSCTFGTKTRTAKLVRASRPFADINAAIGYAIRKFRPYAAPNT